MNSETKEILRARLVVGAGGRIDAPRVDLPEGTEAEMIVLVRCSQDQNQLPSAMREMEEGVVGILSVAEAHWRAAREEWEAESAPRTMTEMIGSGSGCYETPEEVVPYLREQREACRSWHR